MKIKNWDKWILEGFNKDEYYTKTDRQEFIEMGRNKIPFDKIISVGDNKKAFVKDDHWSKPYVWVWVNYSKDIDPKNVFMQSLELSDSDSMPYEYYSVEVYRLEDEWYMVRIEYKGVNMDLSSGTLYSDTISYYKCDQWEGLMKLLEDKPM